jgi:Family of unknown function (DUF6603)
MSDSSPRHGLKAREIQVETEDVQKYIDLVVQLFSPILAAVDSPDEAGRILVELGYLPPADVTAFNKLSPAVDKIGDLVDTLEEAVESQDNDALLEALLGLVAVAGELFVGINDFSNAIQANFAGTALLTDTDILATIVRKLADYLVVRFLEDNCKAVYAGLLLAGVIDIEEISTAPTASHTPYVKRTVNWEKLPDLLSDPLATVKSSLLDGNSIRYQRLIYFLYILGVGLERYSQFVPPNAPALATFNNGNDLTALIPPDRGGPFSDGFTLTPLSAVNPFSSLRFPLLSDPAESLGLAVYPIFDQATQKYTGVGVGVTFGGQLQIPLNDAYQITIKFSANLTDSLGFRVGSDGKFTFINKIFTANPEALAESLQFGVSCSIGPTATGPQNKLFVLEIPAVGRLEVGSGALTIGFEKLDSFRMFAEADLNNGQVVLGGEGADGFIASLLPSDGIKCNFNLGVGVSNRGGLYFKGSASLIIRLPLHLSLGPIEIEYINVEFGFADGAFPLTLSTGLSAMLGPLSAAVDEVGVKAVFKIVGDRTGNCGPLDASLGFKPPKGIGFGLNTGAIVGGGYLFFDFEKEEYGGVLEFIFSDFINLHAIGLLTTRMPDGSQGFSLLIIITVEFSPGIQLGYGFTLIGVGGLLGLNRSVRLQPLADGVRTGTVANIMFPQDIIAHAAQLISDLRIIFPPESNKFLIGPMAKLGWGTPTLISLSLGIIIEIPGNLAILGVLRCALPTPEDPVLMLQVSFVGAIEFDKKRLWLFAGLFESRVLFITLDGEMGVLAAFGEDANFVISVGGFHPSFQVPPLPFPTPARIALNILDEDNARIRADCYFAITTNSAQFGAHADLFFGFDDFSITGKISFDALLRFLPPPIYFTIQISCTIALKVFGMGLYSIDLDFTLEGTTPWRAHGRGSISFLCFSVSANFDRTWGDNQETTLSPIEVMAILAREFGLLQNWTATLPVNNNLLVSLRQLAGQNDGLVLHPLGTLHITQRAVPLNVNIDKVGIQKPSDANHFTLTVASAGLAQSSTVTELFAPAQFHEMSDSDKLSSPAYERSDAGLEISAQGQTLTSSRVVKRVARYEQVIIDTNYLRLAQRFVNFVGSLFTHFLNGNASAKSSLSVKSKNQMQPFADTITVSADGYGVAFTENNKVYKNEAVFGSQSAARDYLSKTMDANPELAGSLHVIPQFELNKAS